MPEEPYAIPFGEANIVREGDDVTVVAIGRMVLLAQAGGRAARSATGSSARSSTRARRRRSTWTRSSRASRTPAGSWSSTRPTRAAAWRPTSSRPRRRERLRLAEGGAEDGHAAAHARCRSRPVLEDAYVPTAETIADAVRATVGAPAPDMTATAQKLGMPKWGLSMTEGRVLEWLVEEGAELARRRRGRRGRDREDQRGRSSRRLAGVLRRRVAAEGDVDARSAACSA